MIAWLATAALAEPPRATVSAGWSGGDDLGYTFLTVEPALVRSADASLTARATLSELRYHYLDGVEVAAVSAPGLAVGPAVTFALGDDVSLGAALGFGARHRTIRIGDTVEDELVPDASIAGEVFWRPRQQAQLYALANFGVGGPYQWTRIGAMRPVLPLRGGGPVSLWMGLEATTGGNFQSRRYELGPVAELPIRDLRAVLGVRAGVAFERIPASDRFERHLVLGVGAHWAT